jgi:hypothetical protein
MLNMRALLLTLLLLASFFRAVPATGQADPDSIKHRNNCRIATQVLLTGGPAPHREWAESYARGCPEAAPFLAEAILNGRSETDTVILNRWTAPMIELQDRSVFDAAEEVARDPSATVQARVYAIRVLVWALAPGGWISYADLTDTVLTGRRMCLRFGTPFHTRIVIGEPLPPDYVERVHDVGETLTRDPAQPTAVRKAAYCATFPPTRV